MLYQKVQRITSLWLNFPLNFKHWIGDVLYISGAHLETLQHLHLEDLFSMQQHPFWSSKLLWWTLLVLSFSWLSVHNVSPANNICSGWTEMNINSTWLVCRDKQPRGSNSGLSITTSRLIILYCCEMSQQNTKYGI